MNPKIDNTECCEDSLDNIFPYIEENLTYEIYTQNRGQWLENFEYVLNDIDNQKYDYSNENRAVCALLHILYKSGEVHKKGSEKLLADILRENEKEGVYALIINRLREYRNNDEEYREPEILRMIGDFI
jgi:hypothetical protein